MGTDLQKAVKKLEKERDSLESGKKTRWTHGLTAAVTNPAVHAKADCKMLAEVAGEFWNSPDHDMIVLGWGAATALLASVVVVVGLPWITIASWPWVFAPLNASWPLAPLFTPLAMAGRAMQGAARALDPRNLFLNRRNGRENKLREIENELQTLHIKLREQKAEALMVADIEKLLPGDTTPESFGFQADPEIQADIALSEKFADLVKRMGERGLLRPDQQAILNQWQAARGAANSSGPVP